MSSMLINNQRVEFTPGESVLEAATQAGIRIPSLCYLKGLPAIGACRVCLVEVEGMRDLVASCALPASEDMKVTTNSKRLRKARRTVVELILSEHCGECQTCARSEDCELRRLATELGISEVSYRGETRKEHIDQSTAALVRDSGKCILCRRCSAVCANVQGVSALFPQGRGFSTTIGPAFAQDLSTVACVQCGQCAAVCPVGAIVERDQIDEVWAALEDPDKVVVVQTAPAIRAALGECFGYEAGTLVTGKMVTALRRLGFDAIFDTNFTADLTIMEEGSELLMRLKQKVADGNNSISLPLLSSCSPGWINYVECFYPELIPNLSSCKSPQQMMGALIKSYYAERIKRSPMDIFVVSIMPCTAKKYEAGRPEMGNGRGADVDVVLTTRELARMIKQAGIDFRKLPDQKMDSPLGLSSGAADIFANSGGVMEAAIRTVYEIVTGRELPAEGLHVADVVGLEGIKRASLVISGLKAEWSFLEGVELKVAVANGLRNASQLIESIKSGKEDYHFVEVMTCPGGCIGGGGQPRMTTDEVRLKRMAAIYHEDEGKKLRKSHENPDILSLYADYLGSPLGEVSHHLLHTHYHPRKRV